MDTPATEKVALDRYTDPAFAERISEAIKGDVKAYDVPDGATFADGTPFRLALCSATLRDWIAEMGGESIRTTAHALRFVNAHGVLFLNLPDGDKALTQAFASGLIAYAQESPGFPVWEGKLQLWVVTPKNGTGGE